MSQAIITYVPDVVIRRKRYLNCKDCAVWRPVKEDSVSDDYGVCPRKIYPNNQTHLEDGCTRAVLPVE